MVLLQSMILVRARMEEMSRPCKPSARRRGLVRSRSALRIRLDARQSRREIPAG